RFIHEARRLIIYADGGCRGNPGPMAVGVSLQRPDGEEIAFLSQAKGQGTNNIAEYQAAIEGLKMVQTYGEANIELRMDSELVARQLNGEYRVKNVKLKQLWVEASGLLATFGEATVVHVPREQNGRADELANLALESNRLSLDVMEAEAAKRILAVFR